MSEPVVTVESLGSHESVTVQWNRGPTYVLSEDGVLDERWLAPGGTELFTAEEVDQNYEGWMAPEEVDVEVSAAREEGWDDAISRLDEVLAANDVPEELAEKILAAMGAKR